MAKIVRWLAAAVVFACLAVNVGHAADRRGDIRHAVDDVIQPMMLQYAVPGMAVGIVTPEGSYVFNYGVVSQVTRQPVTRDTLFELGSISKTFTATLASYAQVRGNLALSDDASRYLPKLRGGSFENVTLINLGTHTAGGLPLQVPDAITNDQQLMDYFKTWRPAYAPGTYRTYSNLSIGMLGMIAASSMHEDFVALVQDKLFLALGLRHSYLTVPQAEMQNYAQGYTKTGKPIRLAPGVLAPEAYGVRATADDMVRFVAANLGMIDVDPIWQRAMTATHTGYFQVGPMTQDLIWEQYSYPVDLTNLLAGNSDQMALEPNAVVKLDPPLQPQDNVLIDKTGSTNGFGGYVAFVPARKLGVVLLANKNYPIQARVTAGYKILTWLAAASQ